MEGDPGPKWRAMANCIAKENMKDIRNRELDKEINCENLDETEIPSFCGREANQEGAELSMVTQLITESGHGKCR